MWNIYRLTAIHSCKWICQVWEVQMKLTGSFAKCVYCGTKEQEQNSSMQTLEAIWWHLQRITRPFVSIVSVLHLSPNREVWTKGHHSASPWANEKEKCLAKIHYLQWGQWTPASSWASIVYLTLTSDLWINTVSHDTKDAMGHRAWLTGYSVSTRIFCSSGALPPMAHTLQLAVHDGMMKDVTTRLNSAFYMMKSLLDQNRALGVYGADHELPACFSAYQRDHASHSFWAINEGH